MTQQKLYKYIGYNGTITSPVLLPEINCIKLIEIKADNGYYLTNGSRKVFSIIVPVEDLALWREELLDINK